MQYGNYQYQQPQQPRKFPISGIILGIIVLLVAVTILFYLKQPAVPSDATPIVTPSTSQLKFNAIFASFIDDDFNYISQPNAEYNQDDALYLYVEVEDFMVSNNLDVDVTEDIEIKDATGKTVFAKKGFAILKETYSEKPATLQFSNVFPTREYDIGEYTARIVVTDNLAKKSTEETVQFSIVQKQITIAQLVFAKSISDDYSYVEQPDATYVVGDDVNIYLEITDFTQNLVDGRYEVNFKQGFAVFNSTDDLVLLSEEYVVVNNQNTNFLNVYQLKNSFKTDGLKPGLYRVAIVALDLNNNQTATLEAQFTLS